ncbi:hypothetical protein ACJ73_07038, partial [Blastomyces percursus]
MASNIKSAPGGSGSIAFPYLGMSSASIGVNNRAGEVKAKRQDTHGAYF